MDEWTQPIQRLEALHYRALMILVRDYKKTMCRSELDTLGRANPLKWSKCLAMSFIMKTVLRKNPEGIHHTLMKQSYCERRFPHRTKFYSKADLRIGRQSLANWAGELMNDLDCDWNDDNTNDHRIRIILKKH